MKRGFRGAPRPLLPAMLLAATTNPNAGQEHHAVAQSQPSSSTLQVPSTSSPPVQSPTPIPAPTPTPTHIPASLPTPTPIPKTEPEPIGHTFKEPSPAHQHFSPHKNRPKDNDFKKVKKLEGFLKRRNVVLSDFEEEEPEAQGRKSQDDPLVSLVQGLVTPSMTTVNASGEEQISMIGDIGKKETKGKKVVTSLDFQEEVDNTAEGVNTGSIKVSNVSGQKLLKKSRTNSRRKASLAEAIRLDTLQKEEVAKQVHLDSLLAQRIAEEEELNKQQKKRRAQVQFEAQHYTNEDWDLIRAKIEANAELSKSMTRSEVLKRVPTKRFGEELQTKTTKRLKDDEAKDAEPAKKSGKRRKQMARKGLHTDLDKDDSEDSDEVSKQEDSVSGTKIPINPVPVAMRSPSIATYKIIKQGEKGVYQIVREDGTHTVYINFGAMLKDISRDDLTELYRIVMNRYGMDRPEDELKKVFWKYLKNMFEEPLSTDPIWSELGHQRIINKKLQGGKPDENCYKMLKMMEKQA
ncbi:hypothetical protein Tco_0893349, partial [Tanacetum coccineum]